MNMQMWRAVGETVGVMCAFASKSVMLIEMHVPSVADVAAMETHMATWTSPPRLDQVDAGSFFYDRFYNALWVRTADTKWVVVTKVQPAGRKVFTPADFANQNKLHPRTQYEFDAVLKE
ncbi:hypothetical protein AaE_004229 [Aphanomyces astaci]|uniref:Formyl transferase C-terminal domain-containing protein n=2 Tax=Aphanomyces astaci TaxID=112090 RepID=A0A6A5AB41_APHAT|nr:hypothetical protein AaE_004229 [Aphanomyces astaci]